jgi:DNA-binding MarR family transcriptional regulator
MKAKNRYDVLKRMKGLPKEQMLLMHVIEQRAGDENIAHVTVNELAQETSLPGRSVQNALETLKELGLINEETNAFSINWLLALATTGER